MSAQLVAAVVLLLVPIRMRAQSGIETSSSCSETEKLEKKLGQCLSARGMLRDANENSVADYAVSLSTSRQRNLFIEWAFSGTGRLQRGAKKANREQGSQQGPE